MVSFYRGLLLFLLILFGLVCPASLAQAPSLQKIQPTGAKIEKPTIQAKQVQNKLCECLGPAIDAAQKAYTSLEEDEWPVAIETVKKSIETVKNLSKDCACPEVIAYQKVLEGFLKYAEGGNHLDNVDEPDCPYVTKLYASAKELLNASEKISNEQVKANAKDVNEYIAEETDFLEEECQQTTSNQEKAKGAIESKKKQ